MRQYQLTINETQAKVIKRSCELFSRLLMGQASYIIDEMIGSPRFSPEDLDKIRDILGDLQSAMTKMGSPTAYFGISSPEIPDDARIAFELMQVIRHRIAWDKVPQGDILVDFDRPLPFSKQPMAEMSQVP